MEPTPSSEGGPLEPISTGDLVRRRARAGLRRPAFVSGRLGPRRARTIGASQAQRVAAGRYTGETLTEGIQPGDIETLVNTVTGQAALGERLILHRSIKDSFAIKDAEGKPAIVKNPEDFARRVKAGEFGDRPVEMVPNVPEIEANGYKQTIQALEKGMDRGDPEAFDLDELMSIANFDDHVLQAARDRNGFFVVDKKVADRYREQLASTTIPGGKFGHAMQAWQAAFKSAVLPTSTKWLAGNFFDVTMRALMAGIAPPLAVHLDPRFRFMKELKKTMEAIDPEGADRWFASLGLRGHYGSQSVGATLQGRARAGRTFRQNLKSLLRGTGEARQNPTRPQSLLDLYKSYRDTVYAFNTHFVEETPQFAFLGKQVKAAIRERLVHWDRANQSYDAALKDLAKGLLKTDAQELFADKLARQFGDWSTVTPTERAFMLNFAPFYMWARASTKFVAVTMPADHPIFTGLAAIANDMTADERRRYGFDLFYRKGKGPLPRFLQGGIPTTSGKIKGLAYSTTFGVWADYPGNLANFILPQANSALWAASGLDFTGEHITNEDGTPIGLGQRAGLVGYFMIEPMIPFMAMARTILRGDRQPRGWFPLTGFQGKAKYGLAAKHALSPSPFPGSKSYGPALTDYLRWREAHAQQIWVPIKGGPQAPGRGPAPSKSGLFAPGKKSDKSGLFGDKKKTNNSGIFSK